MSRPSRVSQWLGRGAAAALAAAVIAPLTLSGASAHPGHDDAGATAAVQADAPEGVDWSDYEKLLLTKDTGEPIDLAVLPDSRVLHTARDGVLRLTDPTSGLTSQVAELDVYHNSEDGLQGIALDPNFEENHWVYMAYAPREMSGTSATGVDYPQTTPSGSAPEQLPEGADPETYWDQWLGYNVLSRFQFDPETGNLDLDSEQQIIKIDAQRGQCCHVGADIAFDGDGNLYLSTGDNTPAGTPGANGYTPINNAPGMNPGFDSRRGSGNTNDLRGSILRINVLDDIASGAEPGPESTYTIPEGNLFNTGEYDAELVREEIYVTGVRNPFRIDFDTESGALVWGDYGPDAGSAQADRGPMGYVEWQLTTEPMNGGWPYCHGPNDGGAYNEWNFEDGVAGDVTFDCATGPVNNSTFNTGLEQLPPVTEPQIWYGDEPGDQPEAWDGLVSFTDGGGQAPMGGPIYRYDAENESTTQFPEVWDGHAFMAEFSQDYVAAFGLDELSSDGEVTDIYNFLPNAHLYEQAVPEWSGIMDMEFGPDGSLYVLEYGKGFFRQNPEAGIYRIDYNPNNKTPRAVLEADQISSSDAPLEVQFDASASVDPEAENVTYEWDFEGDGEFVEGEAVESFTYDELGQYTAVVRVTDPQGLFGLAVQEITVGNTAPEIELNVDNGAIFNWGDSVDISVSVTDAEDGNEPVCDRVNWTFGLGHNLHAHPEVSGTGCEFTLETSENAVEHGEGEKIFGTLVVSYTDEAQGDVPATTGEATLVLKPEVQQAEWYDSAEGVSVADDPDASAGSYVTEFEEGDSITFEPVALTHAPSGEPIDTVTARGSGEGTLSLNWQDETLASFDFSGDTGWQDVTAALEQAPEGSGAVVVTSTGGVDLDALTFAASGDSGSEPPVCEDPEADVPADDEFDGTQVDPCRWEIVDYDSDLAHVSDGSYHVSTTDADFYGTDNSPVPNILQSKVLSGDQWTVEAAFTADLESSYQQGGIMVRADEDNYVKIDPVYAGDGGDTPLRVELRSEVNGEVQDPQDDLTDLALPTDGTYHVQLTRDGDTFTGAFSTDGEDWQELPSAVTNASLADAAPGLYALGAQQAEPTTVSFDYFRVVDGEESPEPIEVPVEDVSLQMFSLIPWVDEVGLEAVLERLGEIGFVNIEPFGGNFEGYTAQEFRELAAGYGLSVPSSHYNVDEDSFGETLEFVDTLGQEYVGSGGFAAPGIDTYEDTLATAETMNRLGQLSVAAGVGKFFGHNHDGEFTTMYEHEGEQLSAWEILVAETNPEYVTFELDVAWAAHAGVDVVELIGTYGDRVELLHIKDATDLGGADGPTFTNLGEGEMALQEILAAAQEAPIAYYALEYDMAGDGESFATSGFEYLTGIEAGQPEPEEPVQVTPEEVTFTDEPGTDSDSFVVPEVEGVQYLAGGDVIEAGTHPGEGTVTVTAQAVEGYELAEGATVEWSHTFDATGGPGELVEVTPEEVVFTDEPGTENDAFTIPEVEGVEYVLLGESAGGSPGVAGSRSVLARDIAAALVPTPDEVLEPGTYAAQGSVTIIARAAAGYVLPEGATTEWTFEFSTAGQEAPTDPGADPTDPGADPTGPGADPTGPGQDPTGSGEVPTEGSTGGDLPTTGADVGVLAALAALLLLVGTGIATRARRQHA